MHQLEPYVEALWRRGDVGSFSLITDYSLSRGMSMSVPSAAQKA